MNATPVILPIAVDHPSYAGHFPGQPILPGAALLDMVLLILADGKATTGFLPTVKFFSPLLPGDSPMLSYQASLNGKFSFEVRCNGRKIASGEVIL